MFFTKHSEKGAFLTQRNKEVSGGGIKFMQ